MLQVTENAATHIKKSLQKRGKGIGIKLGVKTSGCSGLSYLLEFVDEINNENEYQVFDSYGIKIFMDHKSAIYLDGTILDFEKEGLQEGFKFVNPNAKDECGCGKSFHI